MKKQFTIYVLLLTSFFLMNNIFFMETINANEKPENLINAEEVQDNQDIIEQKENIETKNEIIPSTESKNDENPKANDVDLNIDNDVESSMANITEFQGSKQTDAEGLEIPSIVHKANKISTKEFSQAITSAITNKNNNNTSSRSDDNIEMLHIISNLKIQRKPSYINPEGLGVIENKSVIENIIQDTLKYSSWINEATSVNKKIDGEYYYMMSKADQFFNTNQYQQSKKQYAEILKLYDMSNIAALQGLGYSLYKLSEFQKAAETFMYIISLKEYNSNIFHFTLECISKISNFNTAFKFIKKLDGYFNDTKSHYLYYYYLGQLYLEHNKYGSAIKHLLKSESMGNNHILLYYNLGIAFDSIGNYQDARKYYRFVLEFSTPQYEYLNKPVIDRLRYIRMYYIQDNTKR